MENNQILNRSIYIPAWLQEIPVKYGIYTAVSLSAYLLLMRLFGLARYFELRVVNLIILSIWVFLALKKYSPSGKAGSMPYTDAVKVSILTSVISVALFAAFTFVYFNVDQQLLADLNSRSPFQATLDPFMVAGIVVLEGLASTVIVALIAVQYFKEGHYKKKGKGSV